MSIDDLNAISLMQRKFFEYTNNDYKKAKGRTYICDHEMHHALDYLHKNEDDYIGITTRFLYNEDIKKIIGFQIYELYKGKEFTEETKDIESNILKYPYHRMGFVEGFKTVKCGGRFIITRLDNKKFNVKPFIELI